MKKNQNNRQKKTDYPLSQIGGMLALLGSVFFDPKFSTRSPPVKNWRKTQILEDINSQIGSDGKKGWPSAVKDRIAYSSSMKDEDIPNAAVTFLWTVRDDVLPKLSKKNLALASNFYTPAGLVGMIRNILGNPYIRYVILFGEEYSSNSKEDTKNDLTSANAIRAFFNTGINEERKIEGFENSVYFDKNIPTEMINCVKENVLLIDLNKKMHGKSIKEKIEEANKLLLTLEKKGPFIEKPMVFGYEDSTESFPHEDLPIIVSGKTIPETWIEVIYNINRLGIKNLMNANTDRWIKEVNNMVAVIKDPQNEDLSLNPFLVPLTKDRIDSYQKEVLSPILPEGKAYTYGNKTRAYKINSPQEVKELMNKDKYRDFEFGIGEHIIKNVIFKDGYCEIDQLNDIIDVLKRDPYSKACIAMTWHVQDELMRKHKSSPCLVLMQAMVHNEKLNLMVFFRSHDMVQGWPENAYGCAAIQKKISEEINVKPGVLTIISGSAQIYAHYFKQVEEMLKKYRKKKELETDPKGNFLISVEAGKIQVIHTDPKNGRELSRYLAENALELKNLISNDNTINTDHAIYIGTELMKAEFAIMNNLIYEQDKGLKAR